MKLHATINGKVHEFAAGLSLLAALETAGAAVPTLCNDKRIKPAGACRMCLVEVKGSPRPVAACMNPLVDGMEVTTHSAALEHERQMILKMLARHYPYADAKEFPEKEFHRLAREYGLNERDFSGVTDPALVDSSHPYIHVDMSRCIDCFRCVRVCAEVQGQFVWQITERGARTHLLPDSGTTLSESSCVSCGACVDTCPTGALEDRSIMLNGSPTKWTKTTCPYCGTGCELYAGTRDGRVVAVKPVMEAPVSQGHLCVKGRYAFDFVEAEDRVTSPMIRRGDDWINVSWEQVFSFIAGKLSKIVADHGSDSVGVLGSARATNEENYLTQKFARIVLGTNNVDCCARVCHTPSAAALKMMLGTGAATNSFDDIERTSAILICGANPTENHPIVGARIKQAVLAGAKLVVIDPRTTELASYANVHLQIRPGTNIPLLNALAHTIIEEGLTDESYLRARLTEFDEFRDFVRDFAPEQVANICGVKAEQIRAAARIYACGGPAMCFHGLGVTEHTQGTEGVMALTNLALLTGNVGRAAAGMNPLRGQNNVQGAAHMGCDPGILTGSIALKDGRERVEKVWGAPLPSTTGLSLMQMMDAAAAGDLKALWIIGYDVYFSNANASRTREAFDNLDLVIVQDMFLNETARLYGDVFLPAASSFEKDGTFMNAERRIQRVRQVMEPRGESRSDWEIICGLARALGKGELFNFTSAEAIWDEVRAVWPAGQGITYDRIESKGLQWPCPEVDHPGTTFMHQDELTLGPRASLRRIAYRPTPEVVDDDFPFLLVSGRTLYQFNAGTMTGRTPNAELRPTDTLDISPDDAARLTLQNDDRVRVSSRYGGADLPIRVTSAVRPGELFATFHDPKVMLNELTGPARDRYVKTPEYKVTAVRIEKQ